MVETSRAAPAHDGGSSDAGRDGVGKPLEYQLIDLLSDEMPDEVQAAVWLLIQFLKSQRKDSTRKIETPPKNKSEGVS